jgi:hypothetical protein
VGIDLNTGIAADPFEHGAFGDRDSARSDELRP